MSKEVGWAGKVAGDNPEEYLKSASDALVSFIQEKVIQRRSEAHASKRKSVDDVGISSSDSDIMTLSHIRKITRRFSPNSKQSINEVSDNLLGGLKKSGPLDDEEFEELSALANTYNHAKSLHAEWQEMSANQGAEEAESEQKNAGSPLASVENITDYFEMLIASRYVPTQYTKLTPMALKELVTPDKYEGLEAGEKEKHHSVGELKPKVSATKFYKLVCDKSNFSARTKKAINAKDVPNISDYFAEMLDGLQATPEETVIGDDILKFQWQKNKQKDPKSAAIG